MRSGGEEESRRSFLITGPILSLDQSKVFRGSAPFFGVPCFCQFAQMDHPLSFHDVLFMKSQKVHASPL